jgi:hypothetical protein
LTVAFWMRSGDYVLLDVGDHNRDDLQVGQGLAKDEQRLEPAWRPDVEQHHIGTGRGDMRRRYGQVRRVRDGQRGLP